MSDWLIQLARPSPPSAPLSMYRVGRPAVSSSFLPSGPMTTSGISRPPMAGEVAVAKRTLWPAFLSSLILPTHRPLVLGFTVPGSSSQRSSAAFALPATAWAVTGAADAGEAVWEAMDSGMTTARDAARPRARYFFIEFPLRISCGDRRFFFPWPDQRLGSYQLDSSRDYELRESKYQLFLVFLPVKLLELMQEVGRLFPFPWHRST